ncbi:ABC transporter permease [Anaeromassilibacillus sp. An200]|uniref:ABC transporter permease n=1 Tax=Anaeromassilibacillus sp. An200 TaxID=1965587 RepID=UPI0013A686A7|nr:ABC transporter permease [Anaeromassilibacillus sp. An200]
MKKTRAKYLFQSIRKGGVSFLAVAVIVAVSIAIFHGFQSSANAILLKADQYFTENNLETLEISCANGLTQEDLQAIASWEGVSAVEGGYVDSVQLETGGERILVQARSLTDTINQPVLVEGELPTAENEAAIEANLAEQKGIEVGDTISLAQDGCLTGDTFTVTGIVNLPVYCCVSLFDVRGTGETGLGSNEYFVCLPQAAFDAGYYSDCYTIAYVDSDVLDGMYYFSDEYTAEEARYLEQLEPLARKQATLRYESLRDEADRELEVARAEIEENEEKLNEARTAIADQESVLEDARSMLEQLTQLGDAASAQRIALEQEIAHGETELEYARDELAEGEQELTDAQKELADAEAEADDLQLQDWILSGRENVGDIRGITTITDTIRGLSIVMALLFLLVAVVISFAAITRVIREQRALIGAQKALGFTPAEIFRHYTLYNLICGILGTLLGWLLGILIVENMSLYIFVPKFCLGDVPLTFTWSTALLSGALCLVVFLAATLLTCTKLVREPAVDLLRGEVPARGKRLFFEKWGFYQKLNLYSRTMVKNVLSDKGRMATTMVGVMGCTALLVACFSMKLGIQNALGTHFDQCASYDYRLVVDSQTGSVKDFAQLLEDENISCTLIQDKLKNFRVEDGRWESAHVVAVPDTQTLEGFIRLTDIHTGEALSVPEDGVLVSRRAAEELQLSAGSTIELMDENGKTHTATVAGVFEHYLPYHQIVTSEIYYAQVMGEEADPSVFLLQGDVSALRGQVEEQEGFLSLRDNSQYERSGGELDMVIAVCTVLSAVMSVLVLLNQISMYISSKARELAVMRVNGYTLSQTKAYVYKDNVVLIVLGLLAGCLFGVAMAYIDVRVIEAGAEHYVRSPNLFACLLACGIMVVFAVVVNLIALRRIKHLNLTKVSDN